MRHIVVFLTVLLLSSMTFAIGDVHNAATHYNRAFEHLHRLTENERILLSYPENPTAPPSPEMREALRKMQPALHHVREASRRPYADFPLDFNEGWFLRLPPLHDMRTLLSVTYADVRMRVHDGETTMAAKRLATAYRTLPHLSDSGVIIASVVNQAGFHLLDDATQFLIDQGALNAADALTVFHAVDEFAAQTDPFNHIEAILGDSELNYITARNFLESGEHDIRELFGDSIDPEGVDQWHNLTEERLDNHIAAHDVFIEDMTAAFAMDDPEAAAAEVARLQEAFLESDNLFAHLAPSYTTYHERKIRAEAALAARVQSLRELVDGDVEPLERANAAMWYLRAVAALESLEPEQLETLRAADLDWHEPLPDELVSLLETHQPIVELFHDGSRIRRCDFTFTRRHRPHPFMPSYAPGMRDGLRLLCADAVRLMRADQPEDAAERLATAYRVIAHLAGDDQIVSALTSHVSYRHVHNLIELALDTELFDQSQLESLYVAFDRIALADPFGYTNAIALARSRLIDQFHNRRPLRDEFADQVEPWSRVVQEADGDRLLGLLLMSEMIDPPNLPMQLHDHLVSLDDVMPHAGVETLYGQIEALAELIAEGDIEAAREAVQAVADVDRRRGEARSDLRRGLMMFQVNLGSTPRPRDDAVADSGEADE